MSRQTLRFLPSAASAARPLASPAVIGRRAASISSSGSRARADKGNVALVAVGLGLVGWGVLDLSKQTDLFTSGNNGSSVASAVSMALGQVQLDAAPAAVDDPSVRIDPSTSLPFPLLLAPLSLPSPLALVGLGVRTVSFLRVKVYSAGFYVAPEARRVWGVEGMGGEERMGEFLRGDEACVMRIVPARSTDFAHLRDGLVRAVQGRLKGLLKAGLLTEAEADRAAASLQTFKSFFPSRSAPKGSELLLVKLPSNAGLAVEFAGVELGRLADEVVAREVFASYFLDGGREISPKLKESIVAGFQSRPQ